VSLESRYGWSELYLSLGAWPERIMDARRLGNLERDELDFYLCFFNQSHSMRDWIMESRLLSRDEMTSFANSYDCMRFCRDIANRYKHLTIGKPGKAKPSYDADWDIWVDHERGDKALSITGAGKTWLVWDLMIECINFWEALEASFDLSGRQVVFRPQ
jgi:hypothetical protein